MTRLGWRGKFLSLHINKLTETRFEALL